MYTFIIIIVFYIKIECISYSFRTINLKEEIKINLKYFRYV